MAKLANSVSKIDFIHSFDTKMEDPDLFLSIGTDRPQYSQTRFRPYNCRYSK